MATAEDESEPAGEATGDAPDTPMDDQGDASAPADHVSPSEEAPPSPDSDEWVPVKSPLQSIDFGSVKRKPTGI